MPGGAQLGTHLKSLVGDNAGHEYQLGTALGLVGYSALLSVTDYMATVKTAKAFTVELDPKSEEINFHLPENRIQSTFEKKIRGALFWVQMAGSTNIAGTVQNMALALNGWNVWGRGNELP